MKSWALIIDLYDDDFDSWYETWENSSDADAIEYLKQWDNADWGHDTEIDRQSFHGELHIWEGPYVAVWQWNLRYVLLYYVKENDA
jgi:hypothetical protein